MTNMNHAFAKALVAERLEEERYGRFRFENLLVNDSLGVGQTRKTCENCGFNTVFTVRVFDRRAHWCGCGNGAPASVDANMTELFPPTEDSVLESINYGLFMALSMPQKRALWGCYKSLRVDSTEGFPVRRVTGRALDQYDLTRCKRKMDPHKPGMTMLMYLTDKGVTFAKDIEGHMKNAGLA